jgi:hypothetical protein
VGTILAAVFIGHGQPNPVPRMRDGDSPVVRLHNWNALAPSLATFGVDFTPDSKALVVAGGAWRGGRSALQRAAVHTRNAQKA